MKKGAHMSKRIDIQSLPVVAGSLYPPPFDEPCRAREEILRAGDATGFKAGDGDGHCLQNRSGGDVLVLEVGTRAADDVAHYPDIDLRAHVNGKPAFFTHRDGTPYPAQARRGPDDK
jgi:hypothetical protein